MGDLPSLAIPSLDWNLHNFGVFNADMSLAMSGAAQFLLSVESDSSTGYLEDALGEFKNRHSKRRRISVCSHDQLMQSFDCSKKYWNFDMGNFEEISEPANESLSRISQEEETTNVLTHTKSGEEAHSPLERLDSSYCSSYKDSATPKSMILDKDTPPSHHDHGGAGRKMRRFIGGVVYPFAMVKPGGVEGDMTINDINERILMPPTRPLRHPVGDYACRPCLSPEGPGLSGKAVVAFTKIRTHGRGTVTIIRTKG